MWRVKTRPLYCSVFGLIGFIAQGCAVTLVASSDEKYLQDVLPQPVSGAVRHANIKCVVDGIAQDELITGDNHNYGPGFSFKIPAHNMLENACLRVIERHFVQDATMDEMVIYVRLSELEYDDLTDVGTSRAAIEVKLYGILRDKNGGTLKEGQYKSDQQLGRRFSQGWRVGLGSKYRDEYSRVTYRALVVTINKIMVDVERFISK